jgi:hypothetical protein
VEKAARVDVHTMDTRRARVRYAHRESSMPVNRYYGLAIAVMLVIVAKAFVLLVRLLGGDAQ